MNNKIFNAPNILTIVAGLGAGLLAANLLLKEPHPEVIELGELPQVTSRADALPPIKLPDLRDTERDISEWYGKPLIINFWATWCAPCLREMPLLQIAHETGSNFTVIGIAADRTEDVKSNVAESGYTYPMLIGEQEALEISDQLGFDFMGLPFTVFTDAQGAILKIHVGELHAEELQQYLTIMNALGDSSISTGQARLDMQNI